MWDARCSRAADRFFGRLPDDLRTPAEGRGRRRRRRRPFVVLTCPPSWMRRVFFVLL